MEELDNRVYFMYNRYGILGIAEDIKENKEFKEFMSDEFGKVTGGELNDVVVKIDSINTLAKEERDSESDRLVAEQISSNYETLVTGGLSKEAAALLSGYKGK